LIILYGPDKSLVCYDRVTDRTIPVRDYLSLAPYRLSQVPTETIINDHNCFSGGFAELLMRASELGDKCRFSDTVLKIVVRSRIDLVILLVVKLLVELVHGLLDSSFRFVLRFVRAGGATNQD